MDEEVPNEGLKSIGQVGQEVINSVVKEDNVLDYVRQAYSYYITNVVEGHLYQANDVHEKDMIRKSTVYGVNKDLNKRGKIK